MSSIHLLYSLNIHFFNRVCVISSVSVSWIWLLYYEGKCHLAVPQEIGELFGKTRRSFEEGFFFAFLQTVSSKQAKKLRLVRSSWSHTAFGPEHSTIQSPLLQSSPSQMGCTHAIKSRIYFYIVLQINLFSNLTTWVSQIPQFSARIGTESRERSKKGYATKRQSNCCCPFPLEQR